MNVFFNKRATIKGMEICRQIANGDVIWWGLDDESLYNGNKAVCHRHNYPQINKKVKKLISLANMAKAGTGKVGQGVPCRIVCANSKVGVSIDFMAGKCPIGTCTYCYVNHPHVQAQATKWEVAPDYLTVERERVFRRFLRRFKEIAPSMSLRFFSLSDCPDSHLGLLARCLDVCNSEGVKTIVLTKNENVCRVAYSLATKVLYSVDCGCIDDKTGFTSDKYNSPTNIIRYTELQKEMPNLIMFTMVVDIKELRYATAMVDLWEIPENLVQYVAYHGQLRNIEGKPAPVQSTMSTKIKPMFLELLTGKACCSTTNKCLGCHIGCGLRNSPRKYKFSRRGI